MTDNSLTLSLARLPRALGSTLHQDLVWVTPDDLGTPSMSAVPGVPLDVSVDFTSVEDGVLVQLTTSVDLVEDEEVEDLFVIGERDTINIETQLRDAIVPLVDPRPLCSADCAGLCDVCGEKWADLPSDHEHFVVDPRLASLASLLGDDAEPGRS